jgi:hypothetical protein
MNNFADIQKKIKKYFKYLFQHGFIVTTKNHQPEHMGFWELVLLSDDCAIKIYDDRGEILISIGTSTSDNWVGLSNVIFYITNGKEFIGNFEGEIREKDEQLIRLARILENHIEKISTVFKDFEKHKSALLAVRETAMDLHRIQYSNRDDLQKYVPQLK